jgi:DNA-binding response OmpR family regulator
MAIDTELKAAGTPLSHQPTRLLLVEDDRRLAELVKTFLEASGYAVMIETMGARVQATLAAFVPELVILDLGLPDINGLAVCERIRPQFAGPILILTAQDGDQDQIAGLENGADDYVIKPVEPAVLLARIRALLRRYATPTAEVEPRVLTFNRMRIQFDARQVMLDGQLLTLSTHEFDLLAMLAQAAGQILSRESLFRLVYHREYDGMDRSIDVRVSQLRKKIGDDPQNPRLIQTVWGRGYVFNKEAC